MDAEASSGPQMLRAKQNSLYRYATCQNLAF